MKLLSPLWASLSTAAVGAVTWLVVIQIGDRREAWDSPLYFTIGLPVIALVAGVVSYFAPVRVWRWALFPFFAQALVMCALASDFGLLPLGLIAFSIIGCICLIPARIGAAMSRKASR